MSKKRVKSLSSLAPANFFIYSFFRSSRPQTHHRFSWGSGSTTRPIVDLYAITSPAHTHGWDSQKIARPFLSFPFLSLPARRPTSKWQTRVFTAASMAKQRHGVVTHPCLCQRRDAWLIVKFYRPTNYSAVMATNTATGAECVPALRRVRTDTRSAYFSQTTYWCKSDGSLIAFSPCCPFKFAFMLLYWALNLIETIGDEYVLGEGAVWKRSLSLRRKSVRRFTMTDYDTCFSPLFGRIQSQGLLPKWVDSSMTWSFYSIITDLNCNRGNPEYFITVVLKLFIPSIT